MGVAAQVESVDLHLPIAFTTRYEIAVASFEMSKLKVLLIKEKRQGSIESFLIQSKNISQKAKLPYALVFTEIPSKTRTLLLKTQTSFMDYKGNLFLPELGLLLRKSPVSLEQLEQRLSPTEQAIMIYLLLDHKSTIQVKEIETGTGVSSPTIYRTLRKFVKKDWLTSGYDQYQLVKSRKTIYAEVLPFLQDPVKKNIFIDKNVLKELVNQYQLTDELMTSGLSALSETTMLDSADETYAISKKRFNALRKIDDSIDFALFERQISNSSELQIWNYQPFSLDGTYTVDPISLYLSVKDVEDPRVEMELDVLKKYIDKILEDNDANQ